MKRKAGLMMLVFILLLQILTGPAAAEVGDDSSLAVQHEVSVNVSHAFVDPSIINDFMENLNEWMQNVRETLENLQETVQDLIPGIGTDEPSEEPPPQEEPPADPPPAEEQPPAEPPPVEEPAPATGSVEGRLADDERNPMSGETVVMGSREMVTNRSGYFYFEDVPFGSYDLYLSDPGNEESIYLTTVHIDANNQNYSVNLIVSLPDPEDDMEEVEVTEVPDEELDDDRGFVLILVIIMLLLLAAITALVLVNRKHIRVVDARTGEEIEKQRVELKPRTRIDLTDAFENASSDAVRVQFLKPAIKKMSGYRIVFLVNDTVAAEIDRYAGELETLVKLPVAPPVTASEAERPATMPTDESSKDNEGQNSSTPKNHDH